MRRSKGWHGGRGRRAGITVVVTIAAPILGVVLAAQAAPTRLVDHWCPTPIDEPLPRPIRHYLIGNESGHDLFAPWIAGRGGAYLGVGSEQNYTMIGIAAPTIAFLLDRDPAVIALHRELGRRIAAAEAPARLLVGLAAAPEGELADAWPALTRHLQQVARRPSTWLSDPVLYARVRQLWLANNIFAVIGDLAGATAMASIASSAGARRARFTVVYLSNAEEAIPDRQALIGNLTALPRAPGALILRTYYREGVPAADGLWSYQVQRISELQAGGGDELRVDPREPGLSERAATPR